MKPGIPFSEDAPFSRAALLLTFALALLTAGPALAEPVTRQLEFERQGLDLDTGAVRQLDAGPPMTPLGWDVLAIYHADRAVRAVILHNAAGGSEIALVDGKTFDEVTASDIESATFTSSPLDSPFGAGAVLLVRTDQGSVFKLGDATENATSVSFRYALLSQGS